VSAPRFNTLDEWLSWQESLHPLTIELGLDRVTTVAERLGVRRPACPVITVAGTNGKGSTVALLEAMLLAAGYRTGCYTSPHLLRYNERVRLAGEVAADEALCESFARIDAARGDISLSYFEFGTLAALDIFARNAVDVIVLEVGLGGRLDAVNLVDCDVAVVTSIGTDHQDWLGQGREAVGREKAGIFRAGRPAVCADPQPPESIAAVAEAQGARLLQVGRDFTISAEADAWHCVETGGPAVQLPYPALEGAAQLYNAAAAVIALRMLAERLPVPEAAIRQGLQAVRLAGRFQKIHDAPQAWVDVAHNPESAAQLARLLAERQTGAGETHAVFAALGDKDIEGIVTALTGRVAHWHLATLDTPRALAVDELARRVGGALPAADLHPYATVSDAWAGALRAAAPQDCIIVFGSFLTVAEALALRL
jgi:dihydrofolate synthase/folylpolyglutamate synthase